MGAIFLQIKDRSSNIPKGESMLLVPVPTLDELSGLAQGAKKEGYRDRTDRV
jgi:hypothetical protein